MRPFLTPALALLALASPTQAQDEPAPLFASASHVATAAVPSPVIDDPATVTPQLVSALRSPSATVRTGALQAVADLAYASPEGVDLRPAIPALLDVFRTDPDDRHRVMALRSLEASGDDGAMAELRSEGWRAAKRAQPAVQRLLFFVLVDHYGLDALRHDADVEALAGALNDSARQQS